LSETLDVDESTVIKRLKVMEMIQKFPHEMKEKDIVKRLAMNFKDKNGSCFCIEL